MVSMEASPARPYHHGNLRSELLASAEQTLRRRGAGELSLRELSRELGVSHAAPRRHFRDKQALLEALALEGFERLARDLGEATARASDDLTDRMAGLARAYVRFATRNAALLELMFATKHRPDTTDAVREAADRAFSAPLALVAEGQRTGQVAAGEPERLAMVAFATFHGLAAMANSGLLEGGELDGVVTDAVDRIMQGLRAAG
jgi:AcrR family transcriptional regulator